jgi:exodeoxyribonuclease VII small subunit
MGEVTGGVVWRWPMCAATVKGERAMSSARGRRNGAARKVSNDEEIPPQEPLAFEEALGKLDETVGALEGGQLPLEDALKLFEEGVRLVQRCQQMLDSAELRVERLRRIEGEGDEAGLFVLDNFALDEDE